MNFNNTFNKYIKKSIYPNLDRHPTPNQKYYNYFIIIPIFNEYNYLLNTLKSINNQKNSLLNNTLVVLVINNSIDSNQSIKLPINKSNAKCTDERGCPEISNGESVSVSTYDTAFTCEIYSNDGPRYIPYV